MNKAELVTAIAHTTGQSKIQVHNAIAAALHSLTAAMSKGERVTLIGFGTFERRQRQARTGVNPQNPSQKLRIPAARVPAFRAGQELKDIVDGRAKLPIFQTPSPSKKSGKKKSGGSKTRKPAKKAKSKKRR
jgi:DNA-binding protein HU-beta